MRNKELNKKLLDNIRGVMDTNTRKKILKKRLKNKFYIHVVLKKTKRSRDRPAC